MVKVRFRFRLWHLLLVVLLASIGMWALTQYGMDTAVVEIEKYRAVKNAATKQAKLQVLFRFRQPSDLAETLHDYALSEVPIDILPTTLESGRTVQFRYRQRPLRIGLGDTTFWEAKTEDPFNKFWATLFEKPDRPLNASEIKVLNSVMR
ncbi:MAG: hypothetical protein WBD20_00670 [Pirellulaceae bacterium]